MFSVLALASAAAAYNATTTVEETAYVTIPCSSTTLTYGSETFTVSEATTLTVKDCSCTKGSSLVSSIHASISSASPSTAAASSTASAPSVAAASSSGPILANGGAAAKVGAAAGVAAAVAYLL